jgi:hypothetical protein
MSLLLCLISSSAQQNLTISQTNKNKNYLNAPPNVGPDGFADQVHVGKAHKIRKSKVDPTPELGEYRSLDGNALHRVQACSAQLCEHRL